MSTYKLIQDIEAEDKILGPLTLRQFIFALIAIFCFYVCFVLVTKHLLFLLVLFLPPALFFGFFALPFGRDQPTEVWALAKLRFWFKPRRRVWNQSGVKELVTITVPKKVERVLTNGLSQTEVRSRLQALADTIDSRGWATKNVNADTYSTQPIIGAGSDRLIDIASLPQEVPVDGVVAADDILDASNNPIARQFDTMIDQSSQAHRQQLIDQLSNIREGDVIQSSDTAVPPAGNWFMPQPPVATAVPAQATVTGAVAPVAAVDPQDEAIMSASLASRANSSQVQFGNLRTMQPLTVQTQLGPEPAHLTNSALFGRQPVATAAVPEPVQTLAPAQTPAVTPPRDPAIISLAKNDDLNVATLAREARKNRGNGNQAQNEVVVSLH